MTRKLKVLGLAAFAILAVSAMSAASAQAISGISKPAESIWVTTTPDGTGKTAHHVFDAAGASITCTQGKGEATIAGTETKVVTTVIEKTIEFTGCSFLGQAASVVGNGCDGHVGISGGEIITSIVGCNPGKTVEFSVASPPCLVSVPEQALFGVTAHNLNANEITVEAHVSGVKYTATGSGCPITGTFSNGNYTTGNHILTGQKDVGGVGGEMVPIQVIP